MGYRLMQYARGGGCPCKIPAGDEPYDWGRIATANALSDVYASDGTPVLAVNLLCWPHEVLPMEPASETFRGAAGVCARPTMIFPRSVSRRRCCSSTRRLPGACWPQASSPDTP